MDGPHDEGTDVQAAIQPRTEPPADPAGEIAVIFERHHRQVFQAAYRITGNPMDAEDVLQTVFMRIVRREGGHGLDDNAGGYLHRAAVNAALDVVRHRRSARSTALDDVAAVLSESPEEAPDRRHDAGEIRERVRDALTRLNPRTAEVFALRYFEGYDNHEIAAMLGTSRSTVAVMLHRARQRLRDEIRDLAGDAS